MIFPLHYLPDLARNEVFKTMCIRDLIAISLLSKKNRRLIKRAMPKNGVNMTLATQENGGVQISGNSYVIKTTEWAGPPQQPQYEIGRMNVSMWMSYVVCEREEGDDVGETRMNTFLDYFVDVFNGLSISFVFDGNPNSDFIRDILVKVNRAHLKLLNVAFTCRNVTPNVFEEIMSECIHASRLDVNVIFPDGYRYTPPSPDAFKLEIFSAFNSMWWRLEDFLFCKKIKLPYNPNFWSPRDLNQCLRKLKESESRLESVEFPYEEESDFATIVEGLSPNRIEVAQYRQSLEIETNYEKNIIVSHHLLRGIFKIEIICD